MKPIITIAFLFILAPYTYGQTNTDVKKTTVQENTAIPATSENPTFNTKAWDLTKKKIKKNKRKILKRKSTVILTRVIDTIHLPLPIGQSLVSLPLDAPSCLKN